MLSHAASHVHTRRPNGRYPWMRSRCAFAVLIAEQLFASGCRFLISLTSAGQITPAGPPPYFVIIDRALRDEGTSYHYAAASDYSEASTSLVAMAREVLEANGLHAVVGSSWTTDAPFRETAQAIEAARAKGLLAVEMEAAALYAFARATGVHVLCLAHVTNTMGQAERDFEKGEADEVADAFASSKRLSWSTPTATAHSAERLSVRLQTQDIGDDIVELAGLQHDVRHRAMRGAQRHRESGCGHARYRGNRLKGRRAGPGRGSLSAQDGVTIRANPLRQRAALLRLARPPGTAPDSRPAQPAPGSKLHASCPASSRSRLGFRLSLALDGKRLDGAIRLPRPAIDGVRHRREA